MFLTILTCNPRTPFFNMPWAGLLARCVAGWSVDLWNSPGLWILLSAGVRWGIACGFMLIATVTVY